MATPKVMKLLDPYTGLMECRVCGERHLANVRPNSKGRYYRGSWQCQYGCKLSMLEACDSVGRSTYDGLTEAPG